MAYSRGVLPQKAAHGGLCGPHSGCDRAQRVQQWTGVGALPAGDARRLSSGSGVGPYLHRTEARWWLTAVLDELEGRLRLHLTAASALGGMGDECGEEKHIVSKLEKTLEV